MTDRTDKVLSHLKMRALSDIRKQVIWDRISQRMDQVSKDTPMKYVSRRTWQMTALNVAAVLAIAVIGTYMFAAHRFTDATHPRPEPKKHASHLRQQHQLVAVPKTWSGLSVTQSPKIVGSTAPWEISNTIGPWSSQYMSSLTTNPRPKQETLSVARSLADFPIREPHAVPGWHRVFSRGIQKQITVISYGKFIGYHLDLVNYIDIYTNPVGEKVAITQFNYEHYIPPVPGATKWQKFRPQSIVYPIGSRQVTGFSNDLAVVYIDPKDSLKELDLYHREEGSRGITEIQIDGAVSLETLYKFAQQYLTTSAK